ncbi:hypothetical protein [Streptomyces rapamycinicus]|uniref:hypothetical protein n=1 Tax=Streptomyces rapamycinicus TaxID=1226757 RepID=UPI0020C97E5F|nr:hypothetical protein [Streptomyces rapamycinicus]
MDTVPTEEDHQGVTPACTTQESGDTGVDEVGRDLFATLPLGEHLHLVEASVPEGRAEACEVGGDEGQ